MNMPALRLGMAPGAVARKVIAILQTGEFQDNAKEMGSYLDGKLDALRASERVKDIRCRGLWVGIEFHLAAGMAKDYCKKLMADGMLCKDTHEQTMRLAPPLCITKDELDWAIERLMKVLT